MPRSLRSIRLPARHKAAKKSSARCFRSKGDLLFSDCGKYLPQRDSIVRRAGRSTTAMAGCSALSASVAFAFPVALSSPTLCAAPSVRASGFCIPKQSPTSPIVDSGQRSIAWKAFRLAPSRSRWRMASFKITLKTPDGIREFQGSENDNILESAENQGVELPYSCRAGACCSCAGVVESGKVDQSEQSFLDDEQIEQGYVLTCIAYPLSDVVITTHKEEDING